MSVKDKELPKGWAWARVDRVGAVRLGRQRSPDKHSGEHATKYLRAANIQSTGLDLTDVLEMDFTPAERGVFLLCAGDILLTEASGSSSQVGRAALWSDELPDCCYQNTIIRFRPHTTLPDYALAVFRHYATSGVFGRVARGVGIQHLGLSRFAELQFPLPPINEQKRIADAVNQRLAEIRQAGIYLRSALNRLVAQRKEVFAAAVSGEFTVALQYESPIATDSSTTRAPIYRKSAAPQGALFELEAVVSETTPERVFGPLPLGWVWTTVDKVGATRLGRQRSPEHQLGEHIRPYLRVANVFEDRIDTNDVLEMNFTPEEYSSYVLEHGDILLNEGQSLALVGRSAMFRDELPGACFQNTLIRFRAGPALDPEFALVVFRHYLHSGQFRKVARGSTNIAHLGLDRFRSMPFPLPPDAEQRAIVAEVRQRLSVIDSQRISVLASINRLPEMERELLAAAVAGELISQQPTDEPADRLLDRLGEPLEGAPTAPKVARGSKLKGDIVKPKSTPLSKASKPTVLLSSVLRNAGRPLPLPELFALGNL